MMQTARILALAKFVAELPSGYEPAEHEPTHRIPIEYRYPGVDYSMRETLGYELPPEPPPLRFFQGAWISQGCGTSCCIGGALAIMLGEKTPDSDNTPPEGADSWVDYVAERLGISYDRARHLTDGRPELSGWLAGEPPVAHDADWALRNLIVHPERKNPWEGVGLTRADAPRREAYPTDREIAALMRERGD